MPHVTLGPRLPRFSGAIVGDEIEYRSREGGTLVAILSLETLALSVTPIASPALVFELRTAAGAWLAQRGRKVRLWSGGPPRIMTLGKASPRVKKGIAP